MSAPMNADFNNPAASPFPYPFDTLEPGFIVNVAHRHGLHEVLGKATDGRWITRAISDQARPLVYSAPDEIVGFELPIYHCYASRNRSLIVMLVNGDEYDVTREDCPEAEEPLFQERHPVGLITFMDHAVSAGFSRVQLTNGYHAWEGTPNDLIDQCQGFATASRRSAGRDDKL